MATSSTPLNDLNMNLSIALPSTQINASPNHVFPNSSYLHGTASTFTEAMPNRVILLGGMVASRLTPTDHRHIAQRFDRVAVEESHALTMHNTALATKVGMWLLAKAQECAVLIEEVASLKAQVAESQRMLDYANRQIGALKKRNADYAELVQVLQEKANRDS
ncbi:hypothetical protein PRUPE_5G057200 [Prunus persica]|uniref:Uncharacterized protein n=1 Tax=Prunus persica TaxID=3760 RepID=A0A251P471_PRUPE|nr:hypothetical protein PRUPE_5G057200 [Prunus persica]